MRSSLLLALALVGCTGALDDPGVDAPPLLSLDVSIDPSDPRWEAEGTLYAGLAWLRAREFSNLCTRLGNHPEIARACPDPLSVELFDLAVAAPIDRTTGKVTLQLDRLPDARVSVGDTEGRVSYGSVIVFNEFDGNGWLDRVFAPRGRRGLRNADEVVDPRESILGASFHHLLELHRRVAFLEGRWQPLSLFYPVFGCDELPQGLSVMDAVLTYDGENIGGDCQARDAADGVFVEPITRDEARSLECPRAPRRMRDPVDNPIDPDERDGFCLDRETYVLVEDDEAGCPELRIWTLWGCRDDDEACEEPDWDYREAPPPDWSCR